MIGKNNEIEIDGISYVKKDSIELQKSHSIKKNYVIVRTYSAGVFAGNLKSRNNKEVILTNARRLWYWDGAASLSQLSIDGVSKPENCKFPCEMDEVVLTEAIEIISCTEKSFISIKGVTIWKK